jgi:hypothetical protein
MFHVDDGGDDLPTGALRARLPSRRGREYPAIFPQYGLGCHGTRPARTEEPGDGRQEVKNQHSQIAHGTIVTSERNPKNAKELRIRHAQAYDAVLLAILRFRRLLR